MIVCVCNNISSKDIINHVVQGLSFDDIQMSLGVASCCGCCEECAREVVAQTQQLVEINLKK